MSDAGPAIEILYRDENLVAADKPSGLLVHRGWAQDETVLMTLVRDRVGRRVHPLHRLDRGTSGVVLFALDAGTAARFQEQLRRGSVEKRYLALVRGVPPLCGTIDHPVPKHPKTAKRRSAGDRSAKSEEAQERLDAVTDFERLAVSGRYALLEARPRTGRLHQIRRHMKHRSWHVIGDVNYGKGEHNRLFRELHGLHRLALHAFELGFEHPSSGERVTIRAPLPEDLAGPLRRLGLDPPLEEVLGRLALR